MIILIKDIIKISIISQFFQFCVVLLLATLHCAKKPRYLKIAFKFPIYISKGTDIARK